MNQKMTTKYPTTKIARKRLSVLQLAESLGYVTEVCCHDGLDCNSLYEWKIKL